MNQLCLLKIWNSVLGGIIIYGDAPIKGAGGLTVLQSEDGNVQNYSKELIQLITVDLWNMKLNMLWFKISRW
jgi:hypothetical protein